METANKSAKARSLDYVSYGLDLGWGAPIGDYIGSWAGPIQGYTTNLVYLDPPSTLYIPLNTDY